MRLDQDHVRKVERSIETDADGEKYLRVDLAMMKAVMSRMTLWERGLLDECLERAAKARRKTKDQRALLAIFASEKGVQV